MEGRVPEPNGPEGRESVIRLRNHTPSRPDIPPPPGGDAGKVDAERDVPVSPPGAEIPARVHKINASETLSLKAVLSDFTRWRTQRGHGDFYNPERDLAHITRKILHHAACVLDAKHRPDWVKDFMAAHGISDADVEHAVRHLADFYNTMREKGKFPELADASVYLSELKMSTAERVLLFAAVGRVMLAYSFYCCRSDTPMICGPYGHLNPDALLRFPLYNSQELDWPRPWYAVLFGPLVRWFNRRKRVSIGPQRAAPKDVVRGDRSGA